MIEPRTLSESTIDYFEQYKQKALEIKSLKDQLRDLQKQQQIDIDTLSKHIISLEQESLGMRRVITSVLENDVDSVEARLTDDPNITRSNLWHGYHNIGGHIEIDKPALQAYGAHNGIITSITGSLHGGVGYTIPSVYPPYQAPQSVVYQNGTTIGKITP